MLTIITLSSTDPTFAACMAIRTAVFIGEQNVPADLEADEFDATALHFLACRHGTAIATARVLLKTPTTAKIGRVAVLAAGRGQGIGAQLMQAIEAAAPLAVITDFILDAQLHAIPFYQRLGYTAAGPVFMDANIPHRHMHKAR